MCQRHDLNTSIICKAFKESSLQWGLCQGVVSCHLGMILRLWKIKEQSWRALCREQSHALQCTHLWDELHYELGREEGGMGKKRGRRCYIHPCSDLHPLIHPYVLSSFTTSIWVLCNYPTSMKEQCKSTTMLDLQIFRLHERSFSVILGQLPRTHMLVMRLESLSIVVSGLHCLIHPY